MQIIDAVYYSLPSPTPDRRAPWKLIYAHAHARHAHATPRWRTAVFHMAVEARRKGIGLELKTNPILTLLPSLPPPPLSSSLTSVLYFLEREDAYGTPTPEDHALRTHTPDYSCIAVN